MNSQPRLFSASRPIAVIAVLLAGFAFLLMQKLGLGPGWGGGAGAGPKGQQGGGDPSVPQAAATVQQPEPLSKPLQITIDDTKYFVDDVSVESLDELVKRATAVPQSVRPPRVRIVRRPTARYVAEKKLTDALETAKIDFVLEK